MTPSQQLILACASLATLTFLVGFRLMFVRVGEMKSRRIHIQSVALSAQSAAAYEDTRASDNYKHLFEQPVLFYALCAMAVASSNIPGWLTIGAWAYVALRVIHTFIQCGYNKVMHRFYAFVASYLLLFAMWIGLAISLF
ncbi:MAG: MAPEG family protein [Pseudomonadota bacterium]